MKNPDWHRDEIILALDLYFSSNGGKINKNSPILLETSDILRSLPLFPNRPDELKFRNANGVYLKLSNFKHFDPSYSGTGMKAGSKMDKMIFDEFLYNQKKLSQIAAVIRKVSKDPKLSAQLINIEDDEQSVLGAVKEGLIIYKLHKVRERNPKIVKLKKDQAYSEFGKLECEACKFEFQNFYGDIGKGYIECHHRIPLSVFKVSTKTRIDDLSLVCSNCHRMLHRKIDSITVEDLGMMIKYDRSLPT